MPKANAKFDLDAALADPAGTFGEPDASLAAKPPRADKVKLLEQWERDARELLVADAEGMPATPENEAALLQRIRRALLELGAAESTGQTTTHGS